MEYWKKSPERGSEWERDRVLVVALPSRTRPDSFWNPPRWTGTLHLDFGKAPHQEGCRLQRVDFPSSVHRDTHTSHGHLPGGRATRGLWTVLRDQLHRGEDDDPTTQPSWHTDTQIHRHPHPAAARMLTRCLHQPALGAQRRALGPEPAARWRKAPGRARAAGKLRPRLCRQPAVLTRRDAPRRGAYGSGKADGVPGPSG